MKKSRTPLIEMLRKAFKTALAAEQKNTSNDPLEIYESAAGRHYDRRKFLRDTGKLGALAGLATLANGCRKDDELLKITSGTKNFAGDRDQKKVIIVGAGIAGLNAAHTLANAGFTNFEIYEGANRTGGRIFSVQNLIGSGLTTENGGEFIDSGHEDMLALASEFNLPLLDMESPSETSLIKDKYFFNGQNRSLAQVIAAFQPFAVQIQADIDSLDNGAAFGQLDQLSISEYLTQIGMTGWIKELLETAYETEFGLSSGVQTSINFLYLFSPDTSGGKFDIFGISDERYKVVGGNQKITKKLADLYECHITTGTALQSISKINGKYHLNFSNCGTKVADVVLLTMPFTKLRQVDFNFDLPAWKTFAIENLGYGTNSKLFLGFTNRQWRTLGYTGYSFSDNGLQSGWDHTQLQGGTKGGYTVYTGGQTGLNLGNGTPQSQANIYLPKLNQLFPGTQSHYNNIAARFMWPTHPWSLGSYACYLVGQYSSINGNEFKKVGKLYFAGEHCSEDFQGYMNGGAETGRLAAENMLQVL